MSAWHSTTTSACRAAEPGGLGGHIGRLARSPAAAADERVARRREAFFLEVLAPFARSGRGGMTFVRVVDGVDLGDPVAAARGRAVFELLPDR